MFSKWTAWSGISQRMCLSFGQKELYVGLVGTSFWQIRASTYRSTTRHIFRCSYGYITDIPAQGLDISVTAVTQTGSNMALTGTFTGANQTDRNNLGWMYGSHLPATGSVTAANSGTFICTAATPTTLTLTNPNGVTQAGPLTGTATGQHPVRCNCRGEWKRNDSRLYRCYYEWRNE